MAAPAPTPGPAPGGAPPPPPPKKASSSGNILSEAFAQFVATGGIVAAFNYLRVELGGLFGIKQMSEAIADDIGYANRHNVVVRARSWAWFCALVYAFIFLGGGFYRIFDSFDYTAVGVLLALFLVVWVYALPVKEGSMRDHAAFRKQLDLWQKRVAELEEKEYQGDPNFRPAQLVNAKGKRDDFQLDYDNFIRSAGANNRDGAKLTAIFHLIFIGVGVMTFIAYLRVHTDGRLPLSTARHYFYWIMPYSVLLFGLPIVVLIHFWGVIIVPLMKGESLLIFARRAVTAALLSGTEYADLLRQEVAEIKARGDDDLPWFALLYFQGTRIMGWILIKWILASWLGWRYGLVGLSNLAFWTTFLWIFVTEGLIAAFRNALEHRLRNKIIFRLISGSGFFFYVHCLIAGRDATPDYTPWPDWWWTKGTFGPPYPDPTPSIVAAGETVADTTEPAVSSTGRFFGALFNLGLVGWLALALVMAGFAYVMFKHVAPLVSTSLKATDNKYLRWFVVPAGVLIVAMLTIAGVVAVLQTIPWLSATKDEVTRSMRDHGATTSSSSDDIDCPRDPQGHDRPLCDVRCFQQMNRILPSGGMQYARANAMCFDRE
jgi:hypothetical protein